eukprot:CAMPEP_0179223442 /NCGR_PEP_ID=MMETSP0797-20121207/7241_1 /TAXON_ID=47934 /ORGANISM="Dinophysis acuminata, Strain DAEP01" /LENGTH=56 /DNA_ID=CAMNT_0020930321 /DNA_START=137 /DNA_END=304 /DNA_ORIENTATION=-
MDWQAHACLKHAPREATRITKTCGRACARRVGSADEGGLVHSRGEKTGAGRAVLPA